MTAGGVPETRYKRVLYGGDTEELDRFGVRNAIRAGELTADSDLALAESEEWRRVVDFPEFHRYLELAATGAHAYTNPLVPPKPPRVVLPMRQRLVNGLLYPVLGGQSIVLIALAVLSVIPGFSIIGRLASTFMMVQIIRSSAEGKTRMPLIDTARPVEMVQTYGRVIATSVLALLPSGLIALAILVGIEEKTISPAVVVLGLLAAVALAAVYYPACLATVAVWDSVLDSLRPAYVLRVVRRIGSDYFIVVGAWFAATAIVMLLAAPVAGVPLLGRIVANGLSLWVLFYVAHLLGYAVYRHAPELGWE